MIVSHRFTKNIVVDLNYTEPFCIFLLIPCHLCCTILELNNKSCAKLIYFSDFLFIYTQSQMHFSFRFFLIIHHQRGTIKYLQTQNHTADDILDQVIQQQRVSLIQKQKHTPVIEQSCSICLIHLQFHENFEFIQQVARSFPQVEVLHKDCTKYKIIGAA